MLCILLSPHGRKNMLLSVDEIKCTYTCTSVYYSSNTNVTYTHLFPNPFIQSLPNLPQRWQTEVIYCTSFYSSSVNSKAIQLELWLLTAHLHMLSSSHYVLTPVELRWPKRKCDQQRCKLYIYPYIALLLVCVEIQKSATLKNNKTICHFTNMNLTEVHWKQQSNAVWQIC